MYHKQHKTKCYQENKNRTNCRYSLCKAKRLLTAHVSRIKSWVIIVDLVVVIFLVGVNILTLAHVICYLIAFLSFCLNLWIR